MTDQPDRPTSDRQGQYAHARVDLLEYGFAIVPRWIAEQLREEFPELHGGAPVGKEQVHVHF